MGGVGSGETTVSCACTKPWENSFLGQHTWHPKIGSIQNRFSLPPDLTNSRLQQEEERKKSVQCVPLKAL